MMSHRSVVAMLAVSLAAFVPAQAELQDMNVPDSFALRAAPQDADEEMDMGGSDMMSGESWDVEGPVAMRSADVQEFSTFDLRFVFDYSTSSDGTDDDFVQKFVIQWGFLEGHELDLMLPINYGDGGYDGNADISVGWQWKLCDGDSSWMPSVAVYNEVRLPSGYHSEGLDWEFRGIMTWPLQEDSLRLHLNPFIKFQDPDNFETNLIRQRGRSGEFAYDQDDRDSLGRDEVSGRHFKAGGVVGLDYRLTDTATVNVDYILDSGNLDGYDMEHSMEAGIDYQIAPNQVFSWSTRWTMDGDDQGDNWGMALAYTISLDGPHMGWGEASFKYPTFEWE